jgi:queuosine precursor transporter
VTSERSQTAGPEYTLLIPLVAIFVSALLIANTVSVKVMNIAGLVLPAGMFVYPLVSVSGDVVTEVYGYRIARRMIWSGLIALVIQNVVFLAARLSPPAEFWPYQESFDRVLQMVPRIAIASMLSYPIGELVNAFVLAKLKVLSGGRGMAGRFVISTLAGQGADSLIFITVAFAATMPFKSLLTVMVTSWLLKVVWETAALPLSLFAASRIKRFERRDALDDKTDFNPLRF